jgi:hypothetical protein
MLSKDMIGIYAAFVVNPTYATIVSSICRFPGNADEICTSVDSLITYMKESNDECMNTKYNK